MRTQLPLKRAQPPTFRPMFVVAKQLDGSRCHLVRRYALPQATLCYMGTQLTLQNEYSSPFSADVYYVQTVVLLSYC